MLKYIKRRPINEGEERRNESKLSELSTSEAGRKVTKYFKKWPFTMTVTWLWVLHRMQTLSLLRERNIFP